MFPQNVDQSEARMQWLRQLIDGVILDFEFVNEVQRGDSKVCSVEVEINAKSESGQLLHPERGNQPSLAKFIHKSGGFGLANVPNFYCRTGTKLLEMCYEPSHDPRHVAIRITQFRKLEI